MRNHDSEIAVVGIETHHDVRFRTRMVATPFAANFVSDHEVTFLYDCLAFAKLLAVCKAAPRPHVARCCATTG